MLFHCEIVTVYAANTVTEKSTLWDELTILKSSFDVPVLGSISMKLYVLVKEEVDILI